MTQEHKPPVEPPLSQDARDLGRALGDQYALNEAEKRAAERGEEFMPGVDEGRRVATAFRELKAHLKFKAEQRRQEEELAGNGGKPLLRQRDIVPPISPQSESPSTETPRAPITTLLADTETLLNALIAECHFLLREVAFRTMCDSKDPVDRLRFLDVTMGMIRAGATVGDSVARLRHGETRQIRQSFVHEQISGPVGRGDSAQR